VDNARKLRRVARNFYLLPQALQQLNNIILSLSLRHITTLEDLRKRTNSKVHKHQHRRAIVPTARELV
jgi:hypothetical protein